MSTQLKKELREQARMDRQKKVQRVANPAEKRYFQRRLNYPEIYGIMPEKVVNQLKKLGIVKREKK